MKPMTKQFIKDLESYGKDTYNRLMRLSSNDTQYNLFKNSLGSFILDINSNVEDTGNSIDIETTQEHQDVITNFIFKTMDKVLDVRAYFNIHIVSYFFKKNDYYYIVNVKYL